MTAGEEGSQVRVNKRRIEFVKNRGTRVMIEKAI